MMQAEALYPLLDALDVSQQMKILEKLTVSIGPRPKKKKREPVLSNAEAQAYLIKHYLKPPEYGH